MRPEDRSPRSRIVANIPFAVGAIAVFAIATGAATLSLPKTMAMILVCMLAAGTYTAICYRIPDMDGRDPHDHAWILRNMTRNLAASAVIAALVLTLNSHGVFVSPWLLMTLCAATSAWAIWTVRRAGR